MNVLPCPDLAEALAFFTEKLGFRLDMIMPPDSPRVAVVSRDGAELRLEQVGGERPAEFISKPTRPVVCRENESHWIAGRAGMEYRDLIPDRLGGRVIASHIRLTRGGEVPDYVHYHKIGFQVIYCKAGRIRVVYQDQGPAFWLEPGDCVLQPPEIRHRVLEAEAGSEVVEVGCPAVHETWVDHEMTLPNPEAWPQGNYGGQRFVRHIAKNAVWKRQGECELRDTDISSASHGSGDVHIVKNVSDHPARTDLNLQSGSAQVYFVLAGSLNLVGDNESVHKLSTNDSLTAVGTSTRQLFADPQSEWLRVTVAINNFAGDPS